MLFALTLALQVRAAAARARPQTRQEIAAAKFVAHARREEQVFFFQWRWESQKNRDLKNTDPRYWSMHCHYDDPVHPGDELHLITNELSRKSMCPIWFQHEGTRDDESITIDNGLPAGSVAKMQKRRAEVLAVLDSAAKISPDNGWVIGQQVRLNVDQQDFDRAARVAADCRVDESFCSMLEGYVLYGRGNIPAASFAFDYAVAKMSRDARCGYLDVGYFLATNEERDAYNARKCADRETINERFWWLGDPLFLVPGNERLTVHLYRQMLLILHSSLTADEYFDWRVKYGGAAAGEMILRYGWPSVFFYNREQNENHFGWLGYTDSSVNTSREYNWPRYHTTPNLALAMDFTQLKATDLADLGPTWEARENSFDENWWAIEHFARSYIGTFEFQAAQFRRERGPLVALAANAHSKWLPDSVYPAYTAALVSMTGPRDKPRVSSGPATSRKDGATVLTMQSAPGQQIISAEFVDTEHDTMPAARARFALDGAAGLKSLKRREIGQSDPVLFAADRDDPPPRGAPDAIERMLPTTTLRAPSRLGLFFETYGIALGDPIELTVTVTSIDRPGLLRRLGQHIGLADTASASVVMQWRDGQPGSATFATTVAGVVVQARSLLIDLSAVKAGRYAIEIGATVPGGAPASSRRDVTIIR